MILLTVQTNLIKGPCFVTVLYGLLLYSTLIILAGNHSYSMQRELKVACVRGQTGSGCSLNHREKDVKAASLERSYCVHTRSKVHFQNIIN